MVDAGDALVGIGCLVGLVLRRGVGLDLRQRLPDRHQQYADAGVDRLIMLCLAFDVDTLRSQLDALDLIRADKIAFVQLSDYIGKPIDNFMARRDTARSARVFPGEGAHSLATAQLVRTLERMGYQGDYSFEVFNEDYQQLPLALVSQRAARSVAWLRQTCGWQGTPLKRLS